MPAPILVAAVLALTLPVGIGGVGGQSTTTKAGTPKSQTGDEIPQYDVVSIKPTPSNIDKTLPIRLPPDGISFHAVPMSMVLRTAFGVEDDRILGAPSWVNQRRYDIEAKVAPEDALKLNKLSTGDRRDMLISLLTQRFNLRYHKEKRELRAYDLVVAKGGPKLTKGDPRVPQRLGAFPLDQTQLGRPAGEQYNIMIRPGHVQAVNVPIGVLVDPLSQFLGRTVIDKTGLTGSYSFALEWTPDNALSPPIRPGNGLNGSAHSEDAPDVTPSISLFTAIQEQLGLKLESDKGSAEVIVIDHIDVPSPN